MKNFRTVRQFCLKTALIGLVACVPFRLARAQNNGRLVGEVTIQANQQPSASGGSVVIVVNGTSETVSFGSFSSTSSIASGIAALFSQNCQSPVVALATGASINFYAKSAATTSATVTVSSSASQGSQPGFGGTVGSVKTLTSIQLAASLQRLPSGNPVTFAANISPSSVSGTVTFSESQIQLGAAPINGGAAQITLSNLSTGTHQITAAYSGDDIYASSNSSVVSVTVDPVLTGVHYTYDELGRLESVTDQTGASARYSYDANGNIISIARSVSGQASLLSFSPSEGEAGTIVTISGANFASTPSQNQVSFNGVSAAVQTSTPNVITAVVPSGASSGFISVTTPNGTSSSTKSFHINNHAGVPLITGFSPAVASLNSGVSLTGSNFAPNASGNIVTLGGVKANITSVSSSQALTFKVPGQSGSGHIAILTAHGTSSSQGDIFVPPFPYSSSQVVIAQRLAPNVAMPVQITQSGQIAVLIVDSSRNQKMQLGLSNSTYDGGCGAFKITVTKPNGVPVLTDSPCNAGSYLSTISAADDGTYTFTIDPQGHAGSADFTINMFGDAYGELSSTQPAAVNITYPGQNGHYTFQGIAGQQINLGITGANFGCFKLMAQTAAGVQLGNTSSCGPNASLAGITLPSTGSYTASVLVQSGAGGTATLSLSSDLTGTLAMNSFVPLNFTTPGQKAHYTFSGNAGQQVNLGVAGANFGCYNLVLQAQNGTQIATAQSCGPNAEISAATLPSSGMYTANLIVTSGATGSASLSLSTDLSGTLAMNSSVSLGFAFPGQNAHFTFSGTAGQAINLGVAGANFGCFNLVLQGPDGSQTASTGSCGPNAAISAKTLPSTGTYKASLIITSGATGSAGLSLSSDLTGTLAMNSSVSLTFAYTGQNAHYAFSANANQQVSLTVGGANFGCYNLILQGPDGSQISSTSSCGPDASLSAQTLPSSGNYVVSLIITSGATGSASLGLSSN